MGECSLLCMAITALGYRLLKFLHCTCTVCLRILRFLLARVSIGFDESDIFQKRHTSCTGVYMRKWAFILGFLANSFICRKGEE